MGLEGLLTITMPRYEITRFDFRYMHHRPLEIQMRMQRSSQLLAMTRRCALQFTSHVGPRELPIIRREVLIARDLINPLDGVEERAQEHIRSRELQQRVDLQGALGGLGAAHAQPALCNIRS